MRIQKILARIVIVFIVIISTLQTVTAQATEYSLTIQANNGYVIKQPDQQFYQQGQTVRLISRPAAGYKFARWEGDATGPRLIADVVMTGNKTVTAVFERWTPPIGIPAPEFGIFETYRMYDDPANRNPALTYTQNSEGGYYTHYVAPTAPGATDTNNDYGTAAKPRTSLPDATKVPAGSVIQIGGNTTLSRQLIYQVIGTAQRPIFIRGADPVNHVGLTGGELYLRSEYLIVENISRPDEFIIVRSLGTARTHHISVRNSTLWVAGALSWDGGVSEDIVFYGNYVNGHAFDPAAGEFPETDGAGGIGINLGSNRVWIIDNVITRTGGDASGGGHAANYTAQNYYIGRNVMFTCGENAVDVKEVNRVVISENVMFNFYGWSEGSDGTAIVIHYGPNKAPINTWVIYNEVFDCSDKAIQVGGGQIDDVYIIGNVIHDIHNNQGTAYAYRTWDSKRVYMLNNTFYNLDNGVNSGVGASGAETHFYNNIISNINGNGYHLDFTDTIANSIIENNLFYQPGGNVKIRWGSHTYTTVAEFIANTNKGDGCIEGDPLFINAANYDFRLQATSPARHKGIAHGIYQLFQDTFGVDIKVDKNGVLRPQADGWDIGAYEIVPDSDLRGRAGNEIIYLDWTVNTTIPVTTTWDIDYYTTTTTAPFTVTGLISTTNSLTLTDHVQNYQWYTVTLYAMPGKWLSDTVRVMPTDRFVYLPLVLK